MDSIEHRETVIKLLPDDDLFMVSAGILNVIEEVSADSFTLEMEDAWVDYFCQVIDLVGCKQLASNPLPLSA